MKKIIVLLSLLLFVLPVKVMATNSIERINGKNRYDTAIQVSKKSFENSNYAIIVSGHSYADSISSINMAARYKAPILYNPKDNLIDQNRKELNRLGVNEIFIIGGENTISKSVEEELKKYYIVIRISGSDRYETSKAVNEYLFDNSDDAVFVDGRNFADSISIASYIYKMKIPLILVDNNNPSRVLNLVDNLKIKNSMIIGGVNSVSDKSINLLPNPIRISGSDRYETSSMIQSYFFSDDDSIIVSSGKDFADPLSGVSLTHKNNINLLLLENTLKEINNDYSEIIIVGGDIAITNKEKDKEIIVYYLPHADDEVLSMGTAIRKDIIEGNEVYMILLTRGGESMAFYRLNDKLKSYGFPEIDKEIFMNARSKEMKESMLELGVEENNLIILDYPNNKLTKQNVYHEIQNAVKLFGKKIHHKTLADFKYEKHPDHLACAHGLKEYINNNEFNKATFYAGIVYEGNRFGFQEVVVDIEIKNKVRKALEKYNIFNPRQGLYGIGYLSVLKTFEDQLDNPVSYIAEEYER